MIVPTIELLGAAQSRGYAIGAFNVYNLEGAHAVIAAAEAERSPVMLQLHPAALDYGGPALVALCLAAARHAAVPAAVHLDHGVSPDAIRAALDADLTSIMADGSEFAYAENIAFTRAIVELVHARGGMVEAELGRLSGTEDGRTIDDYRAKLTDPAQAAEFIARTGIDALAVCIGNVHGHYRSEPRLDFERLAAIRRAVSAPLVLHGVSGLPDALVRRAIDLGICKLNVNTEVRTAYLAALRQRLAAPETSDLLALMRDAIGAMRAVVATKLRLFGSAGRV
jgi:tagatose 1,6-diphosphate aldolase GatY/KbaY